MRSSNKVFIERNSLLLARCFLCQQQIYMMEWLRDDVTWLRLTTMRYLLCRKKQESVVFVKEEFLHKKMQKKEDVFGCFPQTHWHLAMEVGSVKQYVLWRIMKATRLLKSLVKFTHNILTECLLDFCQIFCNLNQFSKTCSYYAFSIKHKQQTGKAADCVLLAFLIIPVSKFSRW